MRECRSPPHRARCSPHWYLGDGAAGALGGGSGNAAAIASWVTSYYTAQSVDGVTVYDLAPAK